MSLSFWGYRAASRLAAPVLARRDAAKLAAAGVPADRRRERAGYASLARPDGAVIWVHAVSVGEAMSVLPLLPALSERGTVVLSTTTATAAQMVAERAPGVIHQFAPLDTSAALHRFLDHWRPSLLVLTESELWPRQITLAHERAIPVALIGARLSDRSLSRWGKLRGLARHMLDRLSLVLAQDDRTARGLIGLGCDAAKVSVTGNLKTLAAPLPVGDAARERLDRALGGRPVWVAASTHPGEEALAARANRALRGHHSDLLLILAPRHPDRGHEIAAMLRRDGWQVAQRSRGQTLERATQIYLADTLGEMGLWFDASPVAFIGGSFSDMGGHNPQEAVQLGCFALSGPSVTNFADLYATLGRTGSARVVGDETALPDAIAERIGAGKIAPPDRTGETQAITGPLLGLMDTPPDGASPIVIAPNFKRRLSGVTATVVRLVPLQARSIAIRATAPALPAHVPQIPLSRLPFLPRRVPRVWHARRNVEMIGGVILRTVLRKRWALLFTSASQRQHTGLTRWLIARMDGVIATSDRTAAYLDRGATVIRHGIDTETFVPADDRAALRARLGLPDGTLIGCYGRIRSSKGTDLFVDAMLRVLPDLPDATALVMGRATERDRTILTDLKARVAAAGLDGRILFLPEVPVHEIAEWYAALDLYVAPQRWEGFGLTPLEAMACAVPVVATRVGAFEELVVDGATGRLLPPDDVVALETAIRDALADPERLATWGAAARAHVAERFTLEGEADALVSVYRDLLAKL